MTRRYEIDNVLNGYNDYDKLRNIYADLRRVLPTPSQEASDQLTTIDRNRWAGSNYMWELFKTPQNTIILERWGLKTPCNPGKPVPVEEDHLHALHLTLHHHEPALEAGIEAIIAKYPRESVIPV